MKFQTIFSILAVALAITFISCSDEGIEPTVTPPTVTETETETETDPPVTNENLEAAPDFEIKTWDNMDLKFADYNDKVLAIWFFGSDCPPCKGIAPEVQQKLSDDFSSNTDYAIIGIDQWDRNNATIESFKNTTQVQFPLGAMGSGVAKDYGTTYDRLVVVNKEGKIVYKATQRANATLDDAVEVVKDLLK